MLYVLAFLIGIAAGLRALTPAAAVCWAARLGWLKLQGTPLAFLGARRRRPGSSPCWRSAS